MPLLIESIILTYPPIPLLVAVLVSLPASFNFLKDPDFRWVGIFSMSVIIFTVIFSLIMVIILPNYAIVKERENLIIWQGIFKTVLQIKTISNVEIVPLKNGEIVSKHGNIIIKAKVSNEKEKIINILFLMNLEHLLLVESFV